MKRDRNAERFKTPSGLLRHPPVEPIRRAPEGQDDGPRDVDAGHHTGGRSSVVIEEKEFGWARLGLESEIVEQPVSLGDSDTDLFVPCLLHEHHRLRTSPQWVDNPAYKDCAIPTRMRRRYTNIAIPIEVAEQIDRFIADPGLGYTSRTQFVLEAIRERLRALR